MPVDGHRSSWDVWIYPGMLLGYGLEMVVRIYDSNRYNELSMKPFALLVLLCK